ncbi:UDP-galactose transporter senju-like [Anneissia japonica]|uniref:UDP-galactose transporter senju-like n=1 Tax=Anneissia japonica TaxID=1529436 RepID=UPI001425B3E6|nr:UDP-galactose transporter senju-like [Anneissia japonica]
MFEDKFSAVIFVLYIVLSVNQGLIVTAAKNSDNEYSFNFTTVVLIMEFNKLFVSVAAYLMKNSVQSLQGEIFQNIKLALLYMLPAALYCLYNNLQFVNLTNFDPTTYYILLQSRIVITGFIYQMFFSVRLNLKQWMSLVILTFGCIIKQVDLLNLHQLSTYDVQILSYAAILILTQVTCSSLASVYIELLLKSRSNKVDIWVQNIFMYSASIVCNMFILWFNGNLFDAISSENIDSLCKFPVLFIIVNWVGLGLVTSLFLKKLNSILKTFASAVDLLLIAILSNYFFAVPLTVFTIISVVIVMLAIWIYSKDPIRPKVVVESNTIIASIIQILR